jgi:spermidine synthase
MNQRENAAFTGVVGVAFVLTGAGALVIEQALERLLSTVVGASADASAIVLAVYFFGMALGGALYLRLRQRVRNGARLYAMLETVIGVWALFIGLFFPEVQRFSALVIQAAGDSSATVLAARVAVGALWILPPTMAMGGSFPAIVQWLSGVRGDADRMTSVFYTLNVVGALVGSMGAAYLLFPALGVRGGLLTVAVAEVLVALGVLSLASRVGAGAASASADNTGASLVAVLRDPSLAGWLFLGFFSGFVMFSFEVVWLHLTGVVIGMSAYSFAAVISMVLLGLFVGGSIASALPDLGGPGRAMVIGAMGVALAYPLWDDIPIWILDYRGVDTFAGGELVRFQYLFLLAAVPSMALGLLYPTLLREPVGSHPREAAIAAIGIFNGVGSLLGALLTGFVLIGSLGSEETYRLLLLLLCLVAGVSVARQIRTQWMVVGGALLVAVVVTAMPLWDRLKLTAGTNVYFNLGFVTPRHKVVFWHEDNTGGITTVVQDKGGLTLLTNGKFQGNDQGEMVDQVSIAALPCTLASGRDRALVIGLGTGQSAGVVADFGFKQVDVAEIARGMVEAADAFSHINGDLLRRPNVKIHVEDGRNLLLRTTESYDLISMEISSIWFSGAASLYSQDFYRLARSRLNKRGVLQQWIQLHHISMTELASVIGTLRSVFPHVSFWLVGSQGILIASDEAPTMNLAQLQSEALSHEREILGERLEHFGEQQLLLAEEVDRLVAATTPIISTDANRFLEYGTPRYNLSRTDHWGENVNAFMTYMSDPRRTEWKRRLAPP